MNKFFNSSTFCILPWVNVSTDTNGDVRLCCVSNKFIEKSNGERYNLGRDKIDDIINSQSFQQIRKDMLQGQKISGCERCYHDESFGGKSNRVWHTVHFLKKSRIREKVLQSLPDNKLKSVEYFDIRFGNLCNLACRSCNPGASSQFNKEISELGKNTNIKKFHLVIDNDNNFWHSTQTFQKNLVDQFGHIEYYYMNGGEPTIISSNLDILKQMTDQGVSEKINLSLNSNMTNSKQEFYDLLSRFKSVRLMASIDGFESMQEYLRYPSAWSQIDKNFKKILSMKSIKIKIQVTPVISKINLEFICDLFCYLDNVSKQFDVDFEINPIILHQPPLLDIQFLPMDYKLACWSKLEKYIESTDKKHSNFFHNSMQIVKTKCHTETSYIENLRDFFQYNDILDNHRQQQLKSINPMLDSFRMLLYNN
jgi:MoaA/NifB/PqqE/SkfB family radical SAM enzyme